MGQALKLCAYSSTIFNQSIIGTVLALIDYNNISLGGNKAIQLSSQSSTEYYVTGPQNSGNDNIACRLQNSLFTQISSLFNCHKNCLQYPFGCPYNETLKVCQCKSNSAVQCEDNVCCINYGHMHMKEICVLEGVVATMEMACVLKMQCPFISGYCKLPATESGICANNRGREFCSYCTDGKSFTYAGIKCVDDSRCSSGYKTLLVFLVFLYRAILTGVILFALKFKFHVGSGLLYCVYSTTSASLIILSATIIQQPSYKYLLINHWKCPSTSLSWFHYLCLSKGMLPIEIIALNYIYPLFFLIFVFIIIFMAHYFRSIAILKSTNQLCVFSYSSLTLLLLRHPSLSSDQ